MERESVKERRSVKMRRSRKVLFRLVLIGFFIFAAVRFCFQQPILSKYAKQIDELQGQIAQEEKRAGQIKDLKQLYETDEYKKRIARDRLGLVEADERIYVDVSGQ